MAAVENADDAAVAAIYTPNASFMPSYMPTLKGREGVQAYIEGARKSGVKKIKVETSELDVNGSQAIETGNYQVIVDGDHVVDKGKYLIEWRNEGGEWYMHKDIFNSNLPAPRKVAQQGQPVWVVVHQVKADRRSDFENFVRNTLVPAIDQSKAGNAQAVQHTRFLIPGEPEPDGSYRYMFVMDPVIEGVDYSIENMMIDKYGEEKGKAIVEELSSMMAGPYQLIEGRQTEL